jgi:uncharacterized NAD-dependent epimerase/dehydratase family protein
MRCRVRPVAMTDTREATALGFDSGRVALLAHEGFPDRAKTALGVLRYADYDVVAVLDREIAGEGHGWQTDYTVSDFVDDERAQDAPIVGRADEAPGFDTLVIGVAPIGGGFDASWREDVERALKAGADVVAGLHYRLNDDAEFVELAEEHGARLVDIREPPTDLDVSEGRARDADATVVGTVGTDCSTGKMTATCELVNAARERGIDAAMVPTGQTGILVAGWGIAVDRAISDFAAGATERMVLAAAADHDLLFVEGQGSLVHPAYSGVTTSILHGAMPDALVMCHVAGREAVHGYESFPIPPVREVADLYESLGGAVAPTEVVAGALATHELDAGADEGAVTGYSDDLGVPAADPVRDGADAIVDAIVAATDLDA